MINTPEVTEVFRTEWPRLVATLLRDVGDLGVAEDAAQDAFVEAATRWSVEGTPERPGAWLLTTARRKVIDRMRRETRFAERMPLLVARAEAPDTVVEFDQALDDQLALLLGCCHPALAPEAQVALTLRAVAGLSTAQIARAFLVNESTMTRRLTRSKTKIRSAVIPFDPPDLTPLNQRLPAVCGVIYSIFTEGHASATDAILAREDLCDESIWLARSTRVENGIPVLLADQDRTQWNQATIARGLAELARAHSYQSGGMFQFQAAVAALHATAPSFEETDWAGVVRLYDVMLRREPSALIALNRAIAVGRLDGPEVALRALDAIPLADDLAGDLDDYVYFHSARAEALAELGRSDESRDAYRRAITISTNASERSQLERRADLLT
jgi:RNA polymerase sigma-70 factor (ECF subfamily)